MTAGFDPKLDLQIIRIIRAPRQRTWEAWINPEQLAQWWIPAPAKCRVVELDTTPGGAFITEMDEDGSGFQPHLSACFLAIEPGERIVFTNALIGGWRPAPDPLITAIITFRDNPEGTEYTARAMHKDPVVKDMHDKLGFADGWGTVAAQLAKLVE